MFFAFSWSTYSKSSNLSVKIPAAKGHFFSINRTTDFLTTVGRFYEIFLPQSFSNQIDLMNKTLINDSTKSSEQIDDVTVEFVDNQDENVFYQSNQESNLNGSIVYSLPHHDLEGGDVVISISQAFYYHVCLMFFVYDVIF